MSPKQKPTKPIDIYVRVSRVNGRDVEDVDGAADKQERRCRAVLEGDGLKVGKVFSDLDESGAKKSRPQFDKMLARIESGESGGVIVFNLSRLTRAADLAERILWIEKQGGTFFSVQEKVDTSTPTGLLVIRVLDAINAMKVDETRQQFAYDQARAIARGIPIGVAPAGYEFVYKRDADGEVELDRYAKPVKKGLRKVETDCEKIAQAYRVVAGGGSWSEAARVIEGVSSSRREGGKWTATGARKMIANPIYKGVLRNGVEHFFPHLAVVSQETWEKANRPKSQPGRRRRPGKALLADGLLRCEGCGRALPESQTPGRHKTYRYYRCNNGGTICPAPARVRAQEIEAWAVAQAFSYLSEAPVPYGEELDVEKQTALENEAANAKARHRLALAQLDPENPEDMALLDELKATADAAARALHGYVSSAGVKLISADAVETIFTEKLTIAGQRSVLRAIIETITVDKGAKRATVERGPLTVPTFDGVHINFKDNPWTDLALVTSEMAS